MRRIQSFGAMARSENVENGQGGDDVKALVFCSLQDFRARHFEDQVGQRVRIQFQRNVDAAILGHVHIDRSPVRMGPFPDYLAHLRRMRVEDIDGPTETERDSNLDADEIGDVGVLAVQRIDVTRCGGRPPPWSPIVGQQMAVHIPPGVMERRTERHDSRAHGAIGQVVANLPYCARRNRGVEHSGYAAGHVRRAGDGA